MNYKTKQILTDSKTEKSLFLGLDLGQAQDFSALAIIQCVRTITSEYNLPGWGDAVKTKHKVEQLHCIHLERWRLRTSYPSIVADVVELTNNLDAPASPDLKPVLAIDATGVGAPVVDLFKRERINAQLVPIQIVGGANGSKENGMTRVPKRDLVSVVQVGLQNRTLKIASGLDLAETLSRELQNFSVKITDAANDVYGAWREGTHDDLVLALALAAWKANQPIFRGVPVKKTVSYFYDS
ncbi:MAG: hypothetical protein WKF90_12100 [Pyrinomonadaceae bacterium]